MELKYKRLIIKLSGEALSGDNGFGIDENTIEYVVRQIKTVVEMGIEVGIISAEAIFGAVGRLVAWTELQLTIWACLQLLLIL